ncbi:GntR family transcriptional regulator [Amycolatopsis endophytica]|uniref:DNA-binding GntR family transcriptional regulator n=1 Tax=Amycolatopsis endophytica TaxID=860233 RepID=A0A853B8F8_9PSEU|nr:FCD domain-containing protein [Amycolatopsis endophytica]NYI91598.1 DNA-binding GntR family transcriptional regulator [Amycolatopsis endophytica]
MNGTASTRADAVFRVLRHDILRGRFEPGQKLRLAELQSRYDVSSGVLREVLPRLAEQGLATATAQQGYRVVTVSESGLRDLTDARVALEPLVARMATERGDVEYEGAVLAAHHALARAPLTGEDGDVSEDWISRHETFHHTVLQGCGNSHLLDAAERLRRISAVYRYWSAGETERVHRDLAAEHRAICEAAVARDGEAVATLLAEHIELTTRLLLQSTGRRTAGAEQATAG